MRYSRDEIERIARVAFELATRRRGHVCSVDKANVLEVSRLWRTVVTDVAREYGGVTLTHEYVDAAAMKIAFAPSSFDVVLTENMFGDILSDEAGAVCGSLGLLPSASLGRGTGLFEPVHGSAPDIAGQDAANPIGAIASAAMLLADGLHLATEAAAVTAAIERALRFGLRTRDVAVRGSAVVGTRAFTDAVIAGLAGAQIEPATRPLHSSPDSEADRRRTHA
jgi:3-isopropylmalate dehydrogenase